MVTAFRVALLSVAAISPITGTIAVAEGADSSTASGTVTPPSYTGTIAVTEGADTSTASGTVAGPGAITGTIAATEGDDTSTASGVVGSMYRGPLTIDIASPQGRRVLTSEGRTVKVLTGRGGESISYDVTLYAETPSAVAWTSTTPTSVTWSATHTDGSTALTGTGTPAANGVVTLAIDLTAQTYTATKRWTLTVDADGETWPTNPSAAALTLETLPNR